ncbi:hypothetical protein RRG08_010705, partial [Elysia crispata]
KVIIPPANSSNNKDSDNDEPPLVKRRRLQNLQKERQEEKTRFEQPAFTGLDNISGRQQVPKSVVSVRRRLDFSQILTQTTSPDDSSDESIDNPFASDSSSSESEEHEKKFAELMPVRTPFTKRMSPGTNDSQCLANAKSSSAPSSYVTGLDLSVLQELAEIPLPFHHYWKLHRVSYHLQLQI